MEQGQNTKPEKVFTVSEYIEVVNIALKKFRVKVAGEVTEMKIASSGHAYFSIKDKNGEAVLECKMWRSNYQMCGVKLEEGLEVVLTGYSEVWAPRGRFNFLAEFIELKGEGALKKAYEELKKKLEKEGVFAIERKKPLPDFPQVIGVITSKFGAAINDLLSNLGKFGFQINMVDSRVEGQEAIKDLLGAVEVFRKQEIDVLVIMRGGGSLESLQAFNNEMVVRAIVDFKVPVIAAIGHEKDVPLAALAADVSVSTPTAAANIINKSWEMVPMQVSQHERFILEKFTDAFFQFRQRLWQIFSSMSENLTAVFDEFRYIEQDFKEYIFEIERTILDKKKYIRDSSRDILNNFATQFNKVLQWLNLTAKAIQAQNPEKNLSLGYCIARKQGSIIKTVNNVKAGEDINLQVHDGTIDSKVRSIHPVK